MAGRPVFLYRLRRGARLGTRMRVMKLRPSKPAGRYRAVARLPMRSVRRSDRLFICYRNPAPNAVGDPVRGPSPCGRRRA